MDRHKCPLHGKIVPRDKLGRINDGTGNATIGDESAPAVMPWQDAELIADINAATGQNLMPVNSKNTRKRKSRNGNLMDKNEEKNTSRQRLAKRLLNSKNLRKIGSILDSIEQKQNHQKFHHNFNYSINL